MNYGFGVLRMCCLKPSTYRTLNRRNPSSAVRVIACRWMEPGTRTCSSGAAPPCYTSGGLVWGSEWGSCRHTGEWEGMAGKWEGMAGEWEGMAGGLLGGRNQGWERSA